MRWPLQSNTILSLSSVDYRLIKPVVYLEVDNINSVAALPSGGA